MKNAILVISSPANIIKSMYFSNELDLLSHLSDDWSLLLKNIQKREEIHLHLLQKNKIILQKERKETNSEQTEEEINEYQEQSTSITKQNHEMDQEEREIIQKYQNSTTSSDAVIKLLSRIGANAVQIVQKSSEKIKIYDQSVLQRSTRMKKILIGMLSQKQKVNLQHVINVVLDYSKAKMQGELFKFQKLLKALQSKQFDQLKDLYHPHERPRVGSVQRIRELMIERKRQYSQTREDRDSLKKKDTARKQKPKIQQLLYNIMQLSKHHQWAEEMTGSVEEKKEKIMSELLIRNKFNLEEIKIFSKQEQRFQQRIRQFYENREKESVQNQIQEQLVTKQKAIPKELSSSQKKESYKNKSFTQVLSKKPKSQLAQSIMFNQYLATEAQFYSKLQQFETEEDQITKKRTPKTRNALTLIAKETEDFPQIPNKAISTQQNESAIKYEGIRKEISYQTRKQRFPEINKGTSLDNKFSMRVQKLGSMRMSGKDDVNNMQEQIPKANKKKQIWLRDDKLLSQRTKVILKNVQVGADIVAKRQDFISRREEGLISKQRKKTDSNLLQSTIYCRRTITKFIDSKLNIFL